MDAWISRRDLVQLIEKSIDAPENLRFAIFQAVSNGRFKRMDISSARDLVGYAPQDDVGRISDELADLGLVSGTNSAVPGHNLQDKELGSGMRAEVERKQ